MLQTHEQTRRNLAALFLISLSEIAFEIFIMRVFSIGSWSNFGALVISTALLGIGIAGILLTFISPWIEKHSARILSVSALLLAPLMALSVMMAQKVPFNPMFLGSDFRQIWFIAAYFIMYSVPFFVGAIFVGTLFITMKDRVKTLYFWNMTGSGLGGFFIIACMFLLPPDILLLPVLALAMVAAFLVSVKPLPDGKRLSLKVPVLVAVALSFCVAFGTTIFGGGIAVSEYKAISYVRKYPDSRLVHHSYGPGGEYHVYASSYFHFAPGLSDNAAIKIKKMPAQPFWGLFIDGNGPIGIMGGLDGEEAEYLDYLPMAAPYVLSAKPKVMLVNLGGGINAQVARHKGASSVDIVEPSAELIHLLRDDPNVSRFTDNLLTQPGITVHEGDPRAFCSANPETFDIVEISLVDSIGLSDSGGYPVHESFTYTEEAFVEYMSSLKPDGILSITVWDRLNPPRNVLRLMLTLNNALKKMGVQDPSQSIFSFNLFMSTATILVKKGAYTAGELYDLNNFIKQRSFELLYAPGAALEIRSLNSLLDAYTMHFDGGQQTDVKSFTNTDMYRAAFAALFAGNQNILQDSYVFDISPIQDKRPYYAGYIKPARIPSYMDQLPDISEEWGHLLLFGILLQAVIFGLLVIFVPVAGRWKSLFAERKGTVGVIVYYASLGLSYMLIELFLIQRLGIFLASPTWSTSIVITIMLVFSAAGNMLISRIKLRRDLLVGLSAVLIVGGILFYMFGLDGFLAAHRSDAMAVRIFLSFVVIAPLAMVLGVPYPTGLDSLQASRPGLLPWAWGMNGGLSVAGAALARVVSVSAGFLVLLLIPAVLYAAVGILYRVNVGEHRKHTVSSTTVPLE